jgi:SAM-dependent methyltransferase
MDEVKLGLARQAAAAQGLANVEFRAMNIYELAEPDSYDLVYARFVLQHLSRPVDVLRSMWAAVKVGGVIVVEDADFEGSFCDPPNDGFAFWVDAYQRVLERHGGDPLAGRKLHRHFRAAGIPEPEVAVVQRVDRIGEAKSLPYSTVDATADAIVGEGVATAAEVQAALASLRRLRKFRRRWLAWPSSVTTRTAFVVHLASSRPGLSAPRKTNMAPRK